ncbi:uncharacterized protein hemgn isoform X2 [Sinocyclocheilus anshuiensis]|uniref:uncharacterized protein hemgn isoform X2 n=1 Tax=Sinocyclocheilus anshuiensis TaxID=1608454 RepID=UPI0007BA8919|nr:PREDICTED: hemogen isoform X2 [Sinocyclocheilus anshuiensis]
MEETLEKEIAPFEVKDSNEGGIRLRLRDRDLLKKRKAEAEEKATNQAQSLKRVKKKTSGTPGRKGRPRKEPPVVIPEDLGLAQETDPSPDTLPITEPVLPTIAETLPLLPAEPQPEPAPAQVETMSEKPLEEFLIEDLGPDEEEDMPQKSFIIDTGDDELPCADLNSQVSMAVYPPASAPSQPESLSENLII